MNNKENQGFTSFDFVCMIISFVVIVAVTAPIIQKNIQSDQSLEKAKFETTQLGHDLIDPRSILSDSADNLHSKTKSRMIASVEKTFVKPDVESLKTHLKNGEWEGDIGQDPWGRPYHFSFLRNAKGQATHIAVWSDGPNQHSDTSIEAAMKSNPNPQSLEFKGDDLGSVIPLR